MSTEAPSEAERMRRIPGIAFMDSGTGRVAVVKGTGIKIWMLMDVYHQAGEDWQQLREYYAQLNDDQLRAALAYYRAFPDEIDAAIAANDAFDITEFWRRHPWSKPTWR